MADGVVFTGDTGVAIDNSLVGTTVYRQRVVIGGDGTSSGFVNPSTVWPSSGTMGLPVRIVGSSGVVLGSVAPSSNWALSSGTAMIGTVVSATSGVVNLSTTSVVGLTTTSVVGLTTTSLVGLSSSIQNYVTNSTTVPVYLGQSSANVVGQVAPSSNWTIVLSSGTATAATSPIGSLSSQAMLVGTVVVSSGSVLNIGTMTSTGGTVLLSTASVVGLSSGTAYVGVVVSATSGIVNLSTTSVVGLTTTSIVNLSSAIANYVTNSTTVPVYLGQSSGNVVGIISQSSDWEISTGTIVGLTTTSIVGLTTTALVGFSTTANLVAGIVQGAGISSNLTSGSVQQMGVDPTGRVIVTPYASFRLFNTANLVTAANTSQQSFIVAQGPGIAAHITAISCFSSAGTTALGGTFVTLFSSSGAPATARWVFPLSFVPDPRTGIQFDFDPPLVQLTANNAWQIVSSSSAVVVNITAQYFITTT